MALISLGVLLFPLTSSAKPLTWQKDDLKVTINPTLEKSGQQQPHQFLITFTNTGSKAFSLYDTNYRGIRSRGWDLKIKAKGEDRAYTIYNPPFRTMVEYIPNPTILKAGESFEQKVSISRVQKDAKMGNEGEAAKIRAKMGNKLKAAPNRNLRSGRKQPKAMTLPPGTYELHLNIHLKAMSDEQLQNYKRSNKSRQKVPAFWSGKVDLPAVSFTVTENALETDKRLAEKADVIIKGRMYKMRNVEDNMINATIRVREIIQQDGDITIKKNSDINLTCPRKALASLRNPLIYLARENNKWKLVTNE
jgi:hypothetical protein